MKMEEKCPDRMKELQEQMNLIRGTLEALDGR